MLIPNVIPFELAKLTVPVLTDCVPADSPAPPPPPTAPLMTMEPFETPTEAPPAPAKISALRLTVPELDCVVLLVAEMVTVPTPRLIVSPLDEADSAPVTDRDVSVGPEMTIEPLEMPADTPPVPCTIIELRAIVPVLLCVQRELVQGGVSIPNT